MWSGQPCAIFIPCAIESMFAFHSFINFSIFYLLFHAPSFAITHGLCDSDGISVYSTTYICIAPKWMVTYVASVYILPRWMSYFTLRCRRSRMYVRFAYGAIQPHTHTHTIYADHGEMMGGGWSILCIGYAWGFCAEEWFKQFFSHKNDIETNKKLYEIHIFIPVFKQMPLFNIHTRIKANWLVGMLRIIAQAAIFLFLSLEDTSRCEWYACIFFHGSKRQSIDDWTMRQRQPTRSWQTIAISKLEASDDC